jgi:hypothetical protein
VEDDVNHQSPSTAISMTAPEFLRPAMIRAQCNVVPTSGVGVAKNRIGGPLAIGDRQITKGHRPQELVLRDSAVVVVIEIHGSLANMNTASEPSVPSNWQIEACIHQQLTGCR